MKEAIAKELEKIIEIPTVLVRKDNYPPEYVDSKKYRKIKVRRVPYISPSLMYFLLQRRADFSLVEKFSSGDFEGFLTMGNAYRQ